MIENSNSYKKKFNPVEAVAFASVVFVFSVLVLSLFNSLAD